MSLNFIFSKTGHSPVLQPEELQGRTSIKVNQVSKNLKIEGKPGKSSSNDALVIEVKILSDWINSYLLSSS